MADETPPPVPTVTSLAVRWLLGQEANTVVLFAVLGAIGWTGYYGVTVALPQHTTSAQESRRSLAKETTAAIKEVAEGNAQAVKDLSEKHTRQVESISKSFDAANERSDNLIREVLEMKRAKPKEVGVK